VGTLVGTVPLALVQAQALSLFPLFPLRISYYMRIGCLRTRVEGVRKQVIFV